MGHQPLPAEISAIVRRLDIDGDQQITYAEFMESISAVSPDFIPINKVKGGPNNSILD